MGGKQHKYEAGQKFGKLTLVAKSGEFLPQRWLCRCDCGAEKIAEVHDVRRGRINSCGCSLYARQKHDWNAMTHELAALNSSEAKRFAMHIGVSVSTLYKRRMQAKESLDSAKCASDADVQC